MNGRIKTKGYNKFGQHSHSPLQVDLCSVSSDPFPFVQCRMWEPDEQLVLRANTKYKKKDGTLFATSRRVAWQQSGSRQLHPAVPYGNIQGTHSLVYFVCALACRLMQYPV